MSYYGDYPNWKQIEEERKGIRTLPAGTVLKLDGIPVELVVDAKVKTHPKNWKSIYGG